MTYIMGDSFGDSLHELPTGTRHFEQALRVDRLPSALSLATPSPLPATQGAAFGGSANGFYDQQILWQMTSFQNG